MNIMASSLNLSEIFNDVQKKLEHNIANMLNDVLSQNNEYKELHDNIMGLPFVVKLVEENKMLKKKLEQYETKRICLEVQEKPIAAREPDKFVYTDDGETILLAKNNIVSANDCEGSVKKETAYNEVSSEDEEEEADASDEEEASAEEEEDEKASAEEEEDEEASAEEEEEEASAEEDEEEKASAEEEEVEEIMIDKKMYYTTNAQNGYIYADDDGDVGEVVGKFVNGKAQFD